MSREITVPQCNHCSLDSIVHQTYSGQNLCGRHLEDSIRKKFNRALKKQLQLPKKEKFTILVAISGGKDSAVLLQRLHETIGKKPNVELIGGCVAEGIEGYRPPSLECAKKLCEQLKLRFETVSFPELGFDEMDDVVQKMKEIDDGKTPCSYCGVFRRHGINFLAKRVQADVIALGHNLDDMAQTVLMNFQNGDLERTLRLAPHLDAPIEGMAPRIVPLRWIPEQEIHLYAVHKKLPIHHEECPHGGVALRFKHRSLVAQMEEEVPGTRHGLLRFADGVKDLHFSNIKERKTSMPHSCKLCGEHTNSLLCKACEMHNSLQN